MVIDCLQRENQTNAFSYSCCGSNLVSLVKVFMQNNINLFCTQLLYRFIDFTNM